MNKQHDSAIITRQKSPAIASPETKLVHGDGEVPRLVVAMVEVAVVHRDQVHVAKDEAIVLAVLQSLRVADVQQLGPVECFLTQLQEHTTRETITSSSHTDEEGR